jgi:serine/threonine-protein kinase
VVSDAPLPDAGELLDGKYSLTRVIGEGGMGVVYEAVHVRLGQRVALKMLLPEIAARPDVVARFEREARAAVRLSGPHVARVLDVVTLPDGRPYMVMEYLEGRDLAAELAERGPLPIHEAVGYLLQACEGMAEAHRIGTVHRDLKPGNLFLNVQGGGRAVKVIDFGISKIADETQVSVTATFSALGTALYMSPEQVRSAKNVDGRSDVWSLGVILYELLAGKPPFEGENVPTVVAAIIADPPAPLRERRPEVPLALEAAVLKALCKNRDERFQDTAAFAAAIERFRDPAALSAPSPAPAPTSKKRGLAMGAVATIALAATGAVAFKTLRPGAAPVAEPAPATGPEPAPVAAPPPALPPAAAVTPDPSPEEPAAPAEAAPREKPAREKPHRTSKAEARAKAARKKAAKAGHRATPSKLDLPDSPG